MPFCKRIKPLTLAMFIPRYPKCQTIYTYISSLSLSFKSPSTAAWQTQKERSFESQQKALLATSILDLCTNLYKIIQNGKRQECMKHKNILLQSIEFSLKWVTGSRREHWCHEFNRKSITTTIPYHLNKISLRVFYRIKTVPKKTIWARCLGASAWVTGTCWTIAAHCQQVAHQLDSPFQVRSYTQAWQSRGQPCQAGAWHESGLGGVWRVELEWWEQRHVIKHTVRHQVYADTNTHKPALFADTIHLHMYTVRLLKCRFSEMHVKEFVCLFVLPNTLLITLSICGRFLGVLWAAESKQKTHDTWHFLYPQSDMHRASIKNNTFKAEAALN